MNSNNHLAAKAAVKDAMEKASASQIEELRIKAISLFQFLRIAKTDKQFASIINDAKAIISMIPTDAPPPAQINDINDSELHIRANSLTCTNQLAIIFSHKQIRC